MDVNVSATEAKWQADGWTNAEGNELATWQQLISQQSATVDARLQLRYQ